MRFKLLVLLMLFASLGKAQVANDNFIRDLIESIADDLPDDYDLSELQDRLTYFYKHKIDLNKTTVEELNTLVFLSPLQISNLFEHLKTNGKLINLLELQAIPDFDIETINRLLPFTTVNERGINEQITLKNLTKFADNDLILRYGRAIEKSKGYMMLPGSRYLGTPDRYLMRYRYTFSNRISAALTAEKDAGEQLFGGTKQHPFDFQSGHIALLNTGRFKKIVLGDYTLQFGQALTLWSGFAFGKSPDVSTVVKREVGLRPYTSANEYSFMRGVATTASLIKNLDFTVFASFRKLDASQTTQPNGEKNQTSINETGLHRTPTEINNKNSLRQNMAGGVLQYQTKRITLGAIGYHTRYSNAFVAGNQAYQTFNFTGKSLTNVGLYYNFGLRNFYFFGEGAKSFNGGLAFINGVLISLSPTLSSTIMYRNYAKNYYSFYNQATAESSEPENEKGIYIGLNYIPNNKLNFSIYADYFKFPWLKFRVDAPSAGYEVLAQAIYTPNKKTKATLRYKSETKQQNTDLNVTINFLEPVKRETYRGEISWKLSKSIGLQNRIEVSQYKKGNAQAEFGYLFYQDLSYKPAISRFSGNLRLAYFNTPSYNSRIYAYEDDVLYSFAFGLYNGKGIRSYLNLKYNLAKHLDFWVRYGIYKHTHATTVGSGLDEINGSVKSDMKVQLRYQF